jgi:hypothetical protein
MGVSEKVAASCHYIESLNLLTAGSDYRITFIFPDNVQRHIEKLICRRASSSKIRRYIMDWLRDCGALSPFSHYIYAIDYSDNQTGWHVHFVGFSELHHNQLKALLKKEAFTNQPDLVRFVYEQRYSAGWIHYGLKLEIDDSSARRLKKVLSDKDRLVFSDKLIDKTGRFFKEVKQGVIDWKLSELDSKERSKLLSEREELLRTAYEEREVQKLLKSLDDFVAS